jgi:molybdate transport system substrate-binding protein
MYEKVISNAISLVPDSRNLINSLKNNDADLVLNWYATTFWDDNKEFVEALPLDDKYSDKAKLVFNLLSTSKNKDLSKQFMDYASSAEGKEIFKKYGFLNDEDMKNFDKVVF